MFENIQICENWQCINSFALWVSSLGTVSVSVIALWLSIKDRFVRMSAKFDTGLIPKDNPQRLNQKVYILSFTNIGVRPIMVTNYEWYIPFQKGKMVIFPQMDHRVVHLCNKFPIELTDGKSGILFFVNDFVINMNDREKFIYPKNTITAYFRIHFFKIYMTTSIGKKIKVKIRPRVRQVLWKEYQAINT